MRKNRDWTWTVWGTAAIAAAFGFVLWATAPAKAADKGGPSFLELPASPSAPWAGLYIGLGVGYQVAATELDVNQTPAPGSLLNIDGLSGQGVAYDARIGLDYRFAGTPIVVGVFGGYGRGEAEFDLSIVGTSIVNASLEQTWNVGGRVGFVAGGALIYGGYKYQRAELEISFPTATGLCTLAAPALRCSQDVGGHGVIAGIEVPLTGALSLGAEYSFTRFDTANVFTTGPGPAALNVDLIPDVHAVMARLNYRFQRPSN